MLAVAALILLRCALTLLVLGLLVVPFEIGSPLALVVNLCGIMLSAGLVVLAVMLNGRGVQR